MTTTVIRHGSVFDSVTGRFEDRDLAIVDGLISSDVPQTPDSEIDATGQLVVPGLIDMHCHVFKNPSADRIGVNQGVTCVLDTGSAGPKNIDSFRELVVDTQATRAFALCNIGSPGLPGVKGGHAATPELISLAGTVEAIERNPDFILGVKVLASSSHTGLMGIEAVKIGRKAASLTNTPLMVHLGNAPPVIEEILELLRPGDIVTHAYHGKVGGVLGYQRKVIPEFKAAVERGVIVDIAHGRASFSFDTCAAALDQGMPVHTISSDLHKGSMDRYAVSLARTMSKLLDLGLTLEEVITACTVTPARTVRMDQHGIGTLEPGTAADVSLLRKTDEPHDVEDSEGQVRTLTEWLDPVGCLIEGRYYPVTETI